MTPVKSPAAFKPIFLLLLLACLAPLLFSCAAQQPAPDTVITPIPVFTPQKTAPPAAASAAPESAEPVPAQTQAPTPVPSQSPSPSAAKPLKGLVIGVDAGHQARSDSELEPVAPGSSTLKKKVSSGTRGVETGVYEYEVNLAVALLLRDLLKEAGATVVMTRESHDVNISNVERATLFNDKKVDLGVRLHCNGSEDKSVRGAFMLVPKDKDYPYYGDCVLAAEHILKAYGEATGIGIKKGITYRSDQTGFNWCKRPVTNIEMGHMTNPDEDKLLTSASFQKKMARGVYNGIVSYFEAKAKG